MSIGEIIEFLVDLMTDEETKRDFDDDPRRAMADRGLSGLSGQDVRDARLLMADDGLVCPRPGSGDSANSGGGGGGHGGDDPIREIRHTTNTFEIDQSRTDIDQTLIDLDIDDRDTTVVDSFNGDTETNVVAIQDNDIQDNDVTTDLDVINIEDSFNETGTAPRPEPGSDSEVSILPVDDPALGSVRDEQPEPAPLEDPVLTIDPVEEPVPDDVVLDPEPDPESDAEPDAEPALG